MKKTLIFLFAIPCLAVTSCGIMKPAQQETEQQQNTEQQNAKVRRELLEPLPESVNKTPTKDTTSIIIMDSAPSTNVVKPKPPTFGR